MSESDKPQVPDFQKKFPPNIEQIKNILQNLDGGMNLKLRPYLQVIEALRSELDAMYEMIQKYIDNKLDGLLGTAYADLNELRKKYISAITDYQEAHKMLLVKEEHRDYDQKKT